MGQNNRHSSLARKVLSHIVQCYPEKSGDAAQTKNSLNEALSSLEPFKPDPEDVRSINHFLIHQRASDIACKAAWALYKDFVTNDQSNA